MSLSVQIGLLLSLGTALASIVGFLYKHRGAVESPPVEARRPIASSLALFRSKWYVIGILVATGSWGLHVAALALAPISLVQSVIAGGLVFLTVVADRIFGFAVTRREWIGVALTATGLAVLAATLDGAGESAHSNWEAGRLSLYLTVCLGLGLATAVAARANLHGGTMLAVSAGLLWGGSDVAIKALSDRLGDGAAEVLLHPLALLILLASLVGLSVSARSLQVGKAVPVIAVTSAAANICTISAGPVVFGEPMPDDPLGLTVRIIAFALVIFAAAFTPPPIRAAGLDAERPARPPARVTASERSSTGSGLQTMKRTFVLFTVLAALAAGPVTLALAETLTGTDAADTLDGTAGPDQIYGEAGDDALSGMLGDDYLEGGPGADRIAGDRGADLAIGGTGDDTVEAGLESDVVYAGAGDDTVLGDAGADTIFGQAGADRLFGGAGRDRLYASGGGDVADGGAGADRITSDADGATLLGGSGQDVITAGGGGDIVARGGAGNDRIRTGAGTDTVVGGPGLDGIAAGAGNDQINARDRRRDRVHCDAGEDTVRADRFDILRDCENVAALTSDRTRGWPSRE